jgi:hypothetical protein
MFAFIMHTLIRNQRLLIGGFHPFVELRLRGEGAMAGKISRMNSPNAYFATH